MSKRFDQDISAVCGCFNLTVTDGIVTAGAHCLWRYGGHAQTRERSAEAALTVRPSA